MPKLKWGGPTASVDDINNVEDKGYKPYMGSMPPAGVYRFRVISLKQGESGSGNSKLVVFLKLDGSWKKEHKKFDGAPVFDHLPMTVAGRVRSLVDGLGVTAQDLLNRSIVDDQGKIVRIGNKKIDDSLTVYVDCQIDSSGDNGPQLKPRFSGYLAVDEDALGDKDDQDDEADDASDDDDDEPPF